MKLLSIVISNILIVPSQLTSAAQELNTNGGDPRIKLFISATPQDRELEEPIPPCGSCRQSIAEYEMKQDANIEIYFMGSKGKVYHSNSLKNLLPFLFEKKHL